MIRFTEINTIYIIGIRGAGTSALAVCLKQMGKNVLGSDVPSEKPTPAQQLLDKNSIKTYESFEASHITDTIDLIIAGGAHTFQGNIEAEEAKKKGIPVVTYAEALGNLMDAFQVKVSVCGTHGKTTTTSLLAHILRELDEPFSHIIGGSTASMDSGGYAGDRYFVAESDEYVAIPRLDMKSKFLYMHPDYIICTNIDYDHPDVFSGLAEVKETFKEFFVNLSRNPDGCLIYCYDDVPARDTADAVEINKKIGYGLSSEADFRAERITVSGKGTSFTLVHNNTILGTYHIPQFGTHSILNTLGVLAFCIERGFDMDRVGRACTSFLGAQRRFQLLYEHAGISLFDDYAHHPRAIEAITEAFRSAYPNRRLILIYQPHTYSRTRALLKESAQALSLADIAYIIDIYGSAREKDLEGTVSSRDIEDSAIQQGFANVKYIHKDHILDKVKSEIVSGDIIVTLGAGDDVFFMQDELKKIIKNKD